ncbi:Astacin-like metalloprotease toxin 1 [Argiope bruennichi]|uniref:Metalloendopeptidase n=1 Tax=Argiope bruennichi TaxID=94029 RepID=A0A8T0FPE5_ARGBR|nr:Astacin-like metalloprotease toxin 1 [Argiope bruennichi]
MVRLENLGTPTMYPWLGIIRCYLPRSNKKFIGNQTLDSVEIAHNALYSTQEMVVSPEHAGIKDIRFRWPGYPGGGVVPYVIDQDLDDLRDTIDEAMEQYHKDTCIRFVPRTNQKNYLRIRKQRGCWSYVGKQQQPGPQTVSLGEGCEPIGTVVHELGHAIGLFHEHQRSDRNTYIRVFEKNIEDGYEGQFNRTLPKDEAIYTRYDITSIMHYGNYAFSKEPGKLKTMEAKNGVPLLEPYDRPGLNQRDIQLIKGLHYHFLNSPDKTRRLTTEQRRESCSSLNKMMWKVLLALSSFFRSPPNWNDDGNAMFHATPYGPQSMSEAKLAHIALHGGHEEMIKNPYGAGIQDVRTRWPGYPGKGEIAYTIDKSLEPLEGLIADAMDQYHQNTCIRFVKRTNEKDYVRLYMALGKSITAFLCSSFVGRIGGLQVLSLGRGCDYLGTIVHELGHAVGLYHEHQRSDRDKYITVFWNNIRRGQEHNFQKTRTSEELIFTEYNYRSIMHYGDFAFSKQPGVYKTMEAKNGKYLMEPYDKPGLNENDIEMMLFLRRKNRGLQVLSLGGGCDYLGPFFLANKYQLIPLRIHIVLMMENSS